MGTSMGILAGIRKGNALLRSPLDDHPFEQVLLFFNIKSDVFRNAEILNRQRKIGACLTAMHRNTRKKLNPFAR